MNDQQAHHAEIRDLAVLGHPQSERDAVRCLRARLQEPNRGTGGNDLFGIAQHGTSDPGPAEEWDDIEPELFGNREITG